MAANNGDPRDSRDYNARCQRLTKELVREDTRLGAPTSGHVRPGNNLSPYYYILGGLSTHMDTCWSRSFADSSNCQISIARHVFEHHRKLILVESDGMNGGAALSQMNVLLFLSLSGLLARSLLKDAVYSVQQAVGNLL